MNRETYTLAEENYLKAIYVLSRGSMKGVSTTQLSERLETKASSVTDMLQRLAEKKVVSYKRYQGAGLTAEGERIALRTIRKHRLWEVFLVEKLQFNWDEVHDIAEQLEHIQSSALTDRLDAFLNYPQFDPHGDPIPNSKGEWPIQRRSALGECLVGDEVILVGVRDSSSALLQYLTKMDLHLGAEFKVVDILEYDQSFVLEASGRTVTLSSQAVEQLMISKRQTYVE